MSRLARLFVLYAIVLAAVVAVFLFPPIAQDQSYHNFADSRSWLGIPNALNVLSNLPFLFVGIVGLWVAAGKGTRPPKTVFMDQRERWSYAVLFAGAALTAFGSSYYHWAPSNSTLVWDRVPMAIGFMGLLAAVISERVSLRAGFTLLGPLVAAGVASVLYWWWSELHGRGDLRPYILVQFLSLLIIVLLIWLMPPRYTRGVDFLIGLGFYGFSKLFEVLDARIFTLGGVVSGHTLKHLAAACAIAWLVRMLRLRAPRAVSVSSV